MQFLGVLLTTLLSVSTAVGETPPQGSAKTAATSDKSTAAPAKVSEERTSCLSFCDTAETRCGSEVRRARAECSKRAANQGRDPFTMRNNDYGYFCGYFGNANACGAGAYSNSCKGRFSRTYGLCMAAMQQNIASMRYDCIQTERTAQGYCRDELRDCKAACPN
jgi:hypothetical protein